MQFAEEKPKKTTVPKVRFALYLDKDQLEWLNNESEITGAPVAEIVRRAIHEKLMQHSNNRYNAELRSKKTRARDIATAVEMDKDGHKGPIGRKRSTRK